ncbi:hypothetical protein BVRB_1g016170 [Beta vulgaris subsp. vulgaris]|nr:hypothetical protein BVRB_1g016170 [Beta vulgaris subsp. vulgaris]
MQTHSLLSELIATNYKKIEEQADYGNREQTSKSEVAITR